MATTYTLIASSTVGSGGASSIDFTSIPATWTDLKIVLSTRETTATANAGGLKYTFNGNTANYSGRWLRGSGSAAVSSTTAFTTSNDAAMNSALPTAGNTANTFSNVEIYIPNYAGSANKSSSVDTVGENNATEAYSGLTSNLWSNTAAITSITIVPNANLFAQYTSAYLYGITKA